MHLSKIFKNFKSDTFALAVFQELITEKKYQFIFAIYNNRFNTFNLNAYALNSITCLFYFYFYCSIETIQNRNRVCRA